MRIRKTTLLWPALLTLILTIAFSQSLRGTDDLHYARAAMAILPGDHAEPVFLEPNHQTSRLGAIFPLVGVFALMGQSTLSLALLPLLCTVLTAALVAWLAGRFWGAAAGLTAGLLYAIFPLSTYHSSDYVPEPLVTLELCLAAMLFLYGIEARRARAGLLLMLVGLVIGIAYLTTEVGALMLPVLYLYLLSTRRSAYRHSWLLVGFLLVLGFELAYHATVDGDPFHRFSQAGNYARDPMVQQANTDLAYRLLKAYPSTFVWPNTSFGALGPLMALGGLYGLFNLRESRLFVFWAAVILLFYNFMSASFTHYVALPVAMRLLLPACVPLLILSAKPLVDLWRWSARLRSRTSRTAIQVVYLAGVLGITALSLFSMSLNRSPGLATAVARNAEGATAVLQDQPQVTIVTDQASARSLQFYRRFNSRDSYFDLEAAATLADGSRLSRGQPIFVVLNGAIIHESQISGHTYGAGLSLELNARSTLSRLQPRPDATVFRVQFPRDALLARLLHVPAARFLMGDFSHDLALRLAPRDSRLTELLVVRFDQTGFGSR